MRAITLLIFLIIDPIKSLGSENLYQVWSATSYSKITKNYLYSVQLQHRFDLDENKIYEEQVNLSISKIINSMDIAYLFTLGTRNLYEQLNELRHAVQLEHAIPVNKRFQYIYRLRQEVRHFHKDASPAFRFRFRNELKTNFKFGSNKNLSGWIAKPQVYHLSLSSEPNFYLNSNSVVDSGFSSHRIILGFGFKNVKSQEFSLSYVYDIRLSGPVDIIRNVLMLNAHF